MLVGCMKTLWFEDSCRMSDAYSVKGTRRGNALSILPQTIFSSAPLLEVLRTSSPTQSWYVTVSLSSFNQPGLPHTGFLNPSQRHSTHDAHHPSHVNLDVHFFPSIKQCHAIRWDLVVKSAPKYLPSCFRDFILVTASYHSDSPCLRVGAIL